MKFSIFTDIDRTIIFSNLFFDEPKPDNIIGIEEYDGRIITHITKEQWSIITDLLKNAYFIPTSARTLAELDRIEIINDIAPKYMVTTNGGKVYVDGLIDKSYEDYMQLMYSTLIVQPMYIEKELNAFIKANSYNDKFERIKQADEMYVMIRFNNLKQDYYLIQDLIDRWCSCGYTEYISHDKLYIIPYFVTKECAVKYLIRKHLPNTYSFGMGDTSMDYNFLKVVDYSLVPAHINFKDDENKIDYISKFHGFDGSEDILRRVRSIISEK